MSDDLGLMPEGSVDRPGTSFVQLKVKDLEPEGGEGFIGVDDVAVDVDRVCWLLLDAPVFESHFQDVAPVIVRRTRDGYEVEMGGLPDGANFRVLPTPDVSTWVRVKVV